MKPLLSKKVIEGLAIAFLSSVLTSPVMAATTVEWGLLYQQLFALHPDQVASVHSDCNKLDFNKSPVNKKSLNPICNICLGEEDGTAAYGALAISGTNASYKMTACASTSTSTTNPVPFSLQQINDLQAMCDSRGGTSVNLDGLIVLCVFE